MKQRIASLQAQISQFDQTLADSKAVLRNFQDNIRLRKERASLTAIDNEIDQLDEDSARKAYRKFETEYNEQRRRQSELQAEVSLFLHHFCFTSLTVVESCSKRNLEERLKPWKRITRTSKKNWIQSTRISTRSIVVNLSTSRWATISALHHFCSCWPQPRSFADCWDVKSRSRKATKSSRWVSSLFLPSLQSRFDSSRLVSNSAIMRFHGLKMKEINDTIGDLWTKTYQGTGSSHPLSRSLHDVFWVTASYTCRYRQDHDQIRCRG